MILRNRWRCEALKDWMQAHLYSPEDFRHSMERSIAAAWMSNQITRQSLGSPNKYTHRQILLYNSTDAITYSRN
jgi:hypothetical protein